MNPNPARLLACGLALAASAAFAQVPAMTKDGPVGYFCGGASADDRRQMKSLESNANAKLVFATVKRGGYLADVGLSISDGKGTQFSTTTEGPVCLLQLPPGKYRVTAQRGTTTRTASLSVGQGSGKPRQLSMSFPEEDLDRISASPEERQQAADAEGIPVRPRP
jgi:hypothetical protein